MTAEIEIKIFFFYLLNTRLKPDTPIASFTSRKIFIALFWSETWHSILKSKPYPQLPFGKRMASKKKMWHPEERTFALVRCNGTTWIKKDGRYHNLRICFSEVFTYTWLVKKEKAEHTLRNEQRFGSLWPISKNMLTEIFLPRFFAFRPAAGAPQDDREHVKAQDRCVCAEYDFEWTFINFWLIPVCFKRFVYCWLSWMCIKIVCERDLRDARADNAERDA